MKLIRRYCLAIFAALGAVSFDGSPSPVDGLQTPLGLRLGADNLMTVPTGHLPLDLNGLEQYIVDVMERWHAAGMAVAIVSENETWAKGFGYASFPSTPVTPHTLFYTGSTTKSFTAAGLSLLIDNSSDYASIQWNTPISHLLRDDFQLSDAWATDHITIEDALSHRTGYPRHDIAFARDTREQIRRLRHLPMSAEPRAAFQYCNHMFTTAGYIIASLTDSWLGDFFRKHLWTPMGMHETFFGHQDPAFGESKLVLADEYHWVNSTGEFIHRQHTDLDWGGAGAVISNVLDYAKYLRCMIDGTGPMSKAGYRELKRPRIIVRTQDPPFTGAITYSLGWFSGIVEGVETWYHGGRLHEFVTAMMVIPSRRIGIVVMSNSGSRALELVWYRIMYDVLAVREERRSDFETRYLDEAADERKAIDTCRERLYPHTPSPPLLPSLTLDKYVGRYYEPGYGFLHMELQCDNAKASSNVSVSFVEQDCHLTLRLGSLDLLGFTQLEHVTGEFWIAWAFENRLEGPYGCLRVQSRLDESGIITEIGVDVRMEGEDVPLTWFRRNE